MRVQKLQYLQQVLMNTQVNQRSPLEQSIVASCFRRHPSGQKKSFNTTGLIESQLLESRPVPNGKGKSNKSTRMRENEEDAELEMEKDMKHSTVKLWTSKEQSKEKPTFKLVESGHATSVNEAENHEKMQMVEVESERVDSDEFETESMAESIVSPMVSNSQAEQPPKQKMQDSLVYSSHIDASRRPVTASRQAYINYVDRPLTPAVEKKVEEQVGMEISQDFFEPQWEDPNSLVPQIIKQSIRKQIPRSRLQGNKAEAPDSKNFNPQSPYLKSESIPQEPQQSAELPLTHKKLHPRIPHSVTVNKKQPSTPAQGKCLAPVKEDVARLSRAFQKAKEEKQVNHGQGWYQRCYNQGRNSIQAKLFNFDINEEASPQPRKNSKERKNSRQRRSSRQKKTSNEKSHKTIRLDKDKETTLQSIRPSRKDIFSNKSKKRTTMFREETKLPRIETRFFKLNKKLPNPAKFHLQDWESKS